MGHQASGSARPLVEIRRLLAQHRFLVRNSPRSGSFVQPPIPDSILNSPSFAVLDFGCGTCTWSSDVKRTYPHADVHGLDLYPHEGKTELEVRQWSAAQLAGGEDDRIEPEGEVLGSITLHGCDATEPLPEELKGKFDLVQTRGFWPWIKKGDYDKILTNLGEVLKPGGWVQIVEMWDYENHTNDPNSATSRYWRLMVNFAYESSGGSRTQLHTLPDHLRGLSSLFDPASVSLSLATTASTGAKAPLGDPKRKEENKEHFLGFARRFKGDEDILKKGGEEFVSSVDGQKDKWPVDNDEWGRLLDQLASELDAPGLTRSVGVVAAQRKTG